MAKIDFNIFSSIFCPTPPEADEIEKNQTPFSPDQFGEGAELILLLYVIPI